MKKKPAERVKSLPSKAKQIKMVTKQSGRVSKAAASAKPKPSLADDPRYAQAVQNYEAGLKAMQEHKFDKAKALLQKVMASGLREVSDRASMHLNTCEQKLSQRASSFKTPEEHYDFAVSLMNMGDFVTAREHMDKIVKQNPKADFGWYGLAVLDCLTGHFEDSLKRLHEAIRLNPSNRFQARNDSDFQSLADDPRFTELLYPEEGAPQATPWNKS